MTITIPGLLQVSFSSYEKTHHSSFITAIRKLEEKVMPYNNLTSTLELRLFVEESGQRGENAEKIFETKIA